MRVMENPTYKETRDAISHEWFDFATRQQVQPLLIPNMGKEVTSYVARLDADGLVLTGGNDLEPRPGGSDDTSEVRNETELALLEYFINQGKPVLGVCRGMHVINSYFGGQLCTDLKAADTHVARNHEVVLEQNAAERFGCSRVETNSFHNQGVKRAGLAPSLELAGSSAADGNVEMLRHPELPIWGIQWHPERPSPSKTLDDKLVKQLFFPAG